MLINEYSFGFWRKGRSPIFKPIAEEPDHQRGSSQHCNALSSLKMRVPQIKVRFELLCVASVFIFLVAPFFVAVVVKDII